MPHGDLPTRLFSAAQYFHWPSLCEQHSQDDGEGLEKAAASTRPLSSLPLLISWPLRVVQKGSQLYLLMSWIGG
jgi:hypothetical protein